MTNLLINGSFEQDWADNRSHHCLVFPGGEERTVGNIFTPSGGWVTWFYHNPGTWDQPEVRDAREIERVHDGDKATLLFTFYRNHDAGFLQQVQVEPGTRLGLSAYAHAWSNHKDGPHPDDGHWSEGAGYDVVAWPEGSQPPNGEQQQDAKGNFTFTVGIDPTGGLNPYADTVAWGDGWHIYNGYGVLTAEATAEAETVTVFLRSCTLWPFKHNDAYWDAVELVAVEEPPDGRGQPRVQYERTYALLPQGTTLAMALAAMEGAYPKRLTVGFSADDAGIGDLDERNIIAVNPLQWPDDLPAFFSEYYPDVGYEPVTASTPAELVAVLKALDGNGDEPPPPPEPRLTRGHIGLHLQNNAAGVTEFVRDVQPSVMKVVEGFERAIPILGASPHTTMVLRHYNNNYDGILDAADPHVGAQRWLDQFKDSVINLARQTDAMLYVESINEVMPSLNEEAVMRAVNLDMAFIDVVMGLGLDNVRPAVFCVAVGNPHESEYPLLVPLARKCEQAGGLMGIHNYWPGNPNASGPDELWQYLAGRWIGMDEVFVADGIYVKWYGGESGIVGGEWGEGWVSLKPFDGWKSPECLNGNWEKYLSEIARMDELTAEWNITHGDRFVGSVLFTTSGPGWGSFDIGTAEIAGIGAMLSERYG